MKMKPHLVSFHAARNLLRLIPADARIPSFFQLILMVFASILELIGIWLVVPMIGILTSSEDTTKPSGGFEIVFNQTREPNINSILYVLIGFYLFKMVYSSFLISSQINFSRNIEQRLATNLHKSYFNQPYSFHLKHNSATLVSSLQNEIELTQRSFVSLFTAITELFITFTIGAALILFSFQSTLAAGAIFGIAVIIYEIGVQKKIVKLGTDLSIQAPQLLKQLIQGFQGIKEIKTYNQEQIFFNEFENHHHQTLSTRTKYQWYVRFPALWYEFVSIVALAAALLVIANETTDNEIMISKIGLLIFACFRLVPALNRISIGLNDLRYSGPAISSVLARTKTDSIQVIPRLEVSFKKSISFQEVSFRYEPEMDLVINRSSLVINKGDSIQVVGASGSGKSTFLDILLGLLHPESGEILLDGQPINALASIMPSLVSYVSQNVYMMDDTIRANIVFGRSGPILDENYLKEILRASQLTEFIGTLPDGLNTKVGEFGSNISGGQRQRIGIARALIRNSEILIFDESTSALDGETEALLLNSLMNYARDKTIIWISHNDSTYEYFSRIVQIENGQFQEVNHPH